MNRRTYLISVVNAELRAQAAILRFAKEFEQNGNQNRQGNSPAAGQAVNAPRNVPQRPASVQQPVNGG